VAPWLEGAGGIGGLLAVYDTNGTTTGANPEADDMSYAYLYNANGDVGQVVDPNGSPPSLGNPSAASASASLVARYEYDPYGLVIGPDTDGDGQRTDDAGSYAARNAIRFSTKPFDPVTGQGYWIFRPYDPKLGRWVTRDPRDELGDVDLYRFCRSNPMSNVDALGDVPIAIPVAGGIAIAEAVAASFGLTLAACLATPECRAAVAAALQDAARSAAEAAKEAVHRCQRVLCNYRNPTWMACPRDVTADPVTAVARAAPSSPEFAGPYPQPACRPDGTAHNCPGGAPGTRFYCTVIYKDRFNKLHAKKWSVNCCSCCYLILSGTSCKALHVAGKDKSPLPEGPP